MKKTLLTIFFIPLLLFIFQTQAYAGCVPKTGALCTSPNNFPCNFESATSNYCCSQANECNQNPPACSGITINNGNPIFVGDSIIFRVSGVNTGPRSNFPYYLVDSLGKSTSLGQSGVLNNSITGALSGISYTANQTVRFYVSKSQSYSPSNELCSSSPINIQSSSQGQTGKSKTQPKQSGSGDDGVTPVNIVNIGDLIASIGLNNECLADSEGVIRLGSIISCLLPYVYSFAGVGLLLFLMSAGFSYLTSAGDAKKAEAAKGKLTAAVIGFIIIIIAFWLTQIVNTVFKLGTGV